MSKDIFKALEGGKLHFVGIGGVSMSGLAKILLSRGCHVSGSDIRQSETTEELHKMGVDVSIGHMAQNVKSPDLVVYTAAINPQNPELQKTRKLSIPAIERAALLGRIMGAYDYSIAVSGTHGKTTTTSMISVIMMEAEKNPTVHIGGKNNVIGGSVRVGGNSFFITEACEYRGGFLNLSPSLAVILNIDFDHADFFTGLDHVYDTFLEFSQKILSAGGHITANADDRNVKRLLETLGSNTSAFGITSAECVVKAQGIEYDNTGCPSFTLIRDGNDVGNITLRVPGRHNAYNALAAISACYRAGCSFDSIRDGLYKFTGTGRRLEYKGSIDGIRVYDDYAHHPNEVRATLAALKKKPGSRVWCVFQPHTYTRTKTFISEFGTAFKDADRVLVTDIYAAREKDTGDIHSRHLVKEVGKKAVYMDSFPAASGYLRKYACPGDTVITMGAGDIHRVAEIFLEHK